MPILLLPQSAAAPPSSSLPPSPLRRRGAMVLPTRRRGMAGAPVQALLGRIWHSGFESNSATEFSSVSGTASIQSATVRSGAFAGRTNPAAATGFFRQHLFGTDQTISGLQRCYLRIASLPAANTTIMRFADTLNNPCAQLRLTTAGQLQLWTASGVQVGSNSATLATGTWYMVELQCDSTTSPGTVAARLEGAVFASGANSAQVPWSRVLVGVIASTTADLFWDDWAVNGAAEGWPGPGGIVHYVPAGDGDAHAWLDTAASAGTASNWQLVDEVPPDDATTLVQSVTLNAEDMYRVTTTLGPNPQDRIAYVMVGIRYRNNVADATTAARLQVKSVSGGTVQQSGALVPNSTTFATNANIEPRNYPINVETDPDGTPWSRRTLDTMQIGQKITTAGTNRIQVTAIWAAVEFAPMDPPHITSPYMGFF